MIYAPAAYVVTFAWLYSYVDYDNVLCETKRTVSELGNSDEKPGHYEWCLATYVGHTGRFGSPKLSNEG
jgi:hypothetical protein